MTYGQPMHAYDKAKIEGDLKVCLTEQKEELTLIGEDQPQSIAERSLAIYDSKKILSLAGVKGGQYSAISDETSDVIVEAASFSPVMVRKTSQRNNVRTESSILFERGVDPNISKVALEFLAKQIRDLIPSAELYSPQIMIQTDERTIKLDPAKASSIYGEEIEKDQVIAILKNLQFKIYEKDSYLMVEVPSFRPDIEMDVDLIADVIRHRGFDLSTMKEAPYTASLIPDSEIYSLQKYIRSKLLEMGLQESLTVDLISNRYKSLIKKMGLSHIKVNHSKSQEHILLRPTLLFSLLQVLKKNPSVPLDIFEMGRIHKRENETIAEVPVFSIIMNDCEPLKQWNRSEGKKDFFKLKLYVEKLAKKLGYDLSFVKSKSEHFHPYRQADIFVDKHYIGSAGELHPDILDHFDIESKVLFAEIEFSSLKKNKFKFKEIVKTPSSTRDWTLTVSEDLEYKMLDNFIKKHRSIILEDYHVMDIFRDPSIGENKKNITLRFVYRDKNSTLLNNVVDSTHLELCEKVEQELSLFCC